MKHVFARKALLPMGWADDVRLGIDGGRIDTIETGTRPGTGDTLSGCLVPGLTNAHSHAFQRALAGHTEKRSPEGRDNFWTWRERMYELAAQVDAKSLYAIARQVYSEMTEAGYTAVAEFHYLHNGPGSAGSRDEMFDALRRAATDSGIRMTYVPVLYERAGFDVPEPQGNQALFALTIEAFIEHYDRVRSQLSGTITPAIGAHSLRAVSQESLQVIAGIAQRDNIPMHLHIAEQQREVDQSMAALGRRPVRWLLENFAVDANWCLVHATHMDDDEVDALASTGAVVCLCPSTEANLGDGLFRLHDYLRAGGEIAIGSDSHISINPYEELRWLEYGQRLATRTRNIVSLNDSHVGRELLLRALAGGLQASSRNDAGIAAGAPADFVALYEDDPMLLGHGDDSRLDALVFSGYRLPVDRVMVNGEWVVVDGTHVSRDESRAAYSETLKRLGALA
jgi:formimidoylglutamate deiminase